MKNLKTLSLFSLLLITNICFATNPVNNYNSNAGANAGANSSATGVGVGTATIKSNIGQKQLLQFTNGNFTAPTGNGTSKVITSASYVSNYPKQTPFAYSPGIAQSFSQDNCANSASLGVSAGFGAVSGGAPVESDACNRRKDVALWLATGQNRIACERMIQDEENLEAMKKAGLDCDKLTKVTPAVYVPPKFIDPDQNYKLDSIFNQNK